MTDPNAVRGELPPQCERIQASLVEFLDGELRGPAVDDVREHLSTCVSCRSELERHEEIGDLLDAVYSGQRAEILAGSSVGGEAEFVRSVRTRAGRARVQYWRRWGALAAAAALVVAGVLWWLSPTGTNAPSPSPEDALAVADEEIFDVLDVLEVLDEEGVELTPELVQVLLDAPSESEDWLDEVFDYLLEEELSM